MSINYNTLHRLVKEIENGVAATIQYTWLDLAQEAIRLHGDLQDLSEVWKAVSADPERTPAEQNLAAHVVDHIDQLLGDHDE